VAGALSFGYQIMIDFVQGSQVTSIPRVRKIMTEDEAREEAIRLGALKPQGFFEGMSATWMGNTGGGRWEDTPLAQTRLKLWTEAILNGEDPTKVKI
jgi:hypothetical protein